MVFYFVIPNILRGIVIPLIHSIYFLIKYVHILQIKGRPNTQTTTETTSKDEKSKKKCHSEKSTYTY